MPSSVLDEARSALKQLDDECPSTSATSKSAVAARQRTAAARRRNAWRKSTAAQQSGALGLVALAAGGYFLWKWWNNRNSSGARSKSQQQQEGQGGRSTFSFDKKGKKAAVQAVANQPSLQAVPSKFSALPAARGPPAPASRPAGNPKKDKRGKQAKKDAKASKKNESAATDAVGQVIAARAKAKGIAEAGTEPEVGLQTVVDYDLNADAYHRVTQWQDKGRKDFKG